MSGVDDDRPEEPENIVYVDDGLAVVRLTGTATEEHLHAGSSEATTAATMTMREFFSFDEGRNSSTLEGCRRPFGFCSPPQPSPTSPRRTRSRAASARSPAPATRGSRRRRSGGRPGRRSRTSAGSTGSRGQRLPLTTGRRLFAPSCWSPRRSTSAATMKWRSGPGTFARAAPRGTSRSNWSATSSIRPSKSSIPPPRRQVQCELEHRTDRLRDHNRIERIRNGNVAVPVQGRILEWVCPTASERRCSGRVRRRRSRPRGG